MSEFELFVQVRRAEDRSRLAEAAMVAAVRSDASITANDGDMERLRDVAFMCYALADAMLEARSNKPAAIRKRTSG